MTNWTQKQSEHIVYLEKQYDIAISELTKFQDENAKYGKMMEAAVSTMKSQRERIQELENELKSLHPRY